MKLIICSPQLGLSPRSTLGGETYDREILTHLSLLGVQVEILLPRNKPYDTSVKNWRVKHTKFSHFPALAFNLIQLPYLFSTYRQHPFQIIRLHAPYFVGIGALIFRMFHPKVKIVAIYHQVRKGFPFDLINKLFIKRWNLIITDSHEAKRDISRRFGIDLKKIAAIPNGAPSGLRPQKKHSGTTKKLKLGNHIVLLFMGLLIPRKNPEFMLQVIKKMNKKGARVKLIICGDGPLKNNLQKSIQRQRMEDQVILHPPVFGSKKQQLYSVADIFLHPAIHEGLPLVVLEAMASGLPIVMSRGYSARELIDNGKNGLLARINHSEEWEKKINSLLKSESRRRKMGRVSREMVESQFTWKLAAQKQYDLLRDLVS